MGETKTQPLFLKHFTHKKSEPVSLKSILFVYCMIWLSQQEDLRYYLASYHSSGSISSVGILFLIYNLNMKADLLQKCWFGLKKEGVERIPVLTAQKIITKVTFPELLEWSCLVLNTRRLQLFLGAPWCGCVQLWMWMNMSNCYWNRLWIYGVYSVCNASQQANNIN